MRVTSDLFVAQLVRRVFASGGFAAVVRRGAEMAGAIFVIHRSRDGSFALYGPAPQTLADEDGTRRFVAEAAADATALDARLEREARFDPDFWVVEIETEELGDLIELASDG